MKTCGIFTLLLIVAAPAFAQTIANPGFETDTFTVFPGYISGNSAVTGWTEATATQQGINPGGGSPFANNGTIPEGSQVGFIQTNANTNSFSNTITGLSPGTQYELSYRVNTRNGQNTRMSLEVDGTALVSSLVTSVGGSNEYGFVVRHFTATAESMPLSVLSSSEVDQTLLIDDFQVTEKASTPWSVSAWTSDADSGIDGLLPYTHAYNLGSLADATINGVLFTGNDQPNPAVPGSFSLTGPGVVFTGVDGNNLTSGGSLELGNHFLYNGTFNTLILEGLTAGQGYRASIFGVAWDDNTTSNRTATFESNGERFTVDEDQFDNNNGIRIDFEFTATGNTHTITYDSLGTNTFHTYGFANRAVDTFLVQASPLEFTEVGLGDLAATLTALNNGAEEAAVFSLVAGAGDTDNLKFQINGDRLEVGAHDFAADGGGTQYSVRIMAIGDVSARTAEAVFVLTLDLDSDTDGLPDAWELAFADDLTILDGMNDADADGDGITDADEYAMNPTADPNGLDPTNPDSDGDDLNDGAELLAGTDPTNPDTDGDDVLDGIESEVGGDPLNKDSDGDGWSDGIEVASMSVVNNASSVPTFAPGMTVSLPIKTDCSSGISAQVEYTHLVSGGDAVTINGIDFAAMNDTVEPAGIAWDAPGGKATVINNLSTWQPTNGGVTGSGMISLMESFTYSNGGAEPGSTQSFTLSGLTAGTTYDLRIYIRAWSTLSIRPIDIDLINGGETIFVTPEGGAPEDRPSEVLMNGGNDDQAYFVNIRYTAQGSELTLNTNVPTTAAANSGSFHLYGLTNEVAVGGASSDIRITSITRDIDNPTAPVTITFESQPGVDYAVDFSTSLNAEGQPGGWLNIEDTLNATGTSTSFTDTSVAPSGAARIFYRVRRP